MQTVRFLLGLVIASVCAMLPRNADAAHIVGGELTYECLGGSLYEVTLELYRDCNSGGAPFDNLAAIGLYSEVGVLVDVLYAPFPQVESLEIETGDPCLGAPPDVCVERGVTSIQVTLPSSSEGYYFVYQRCCRNATILNLVNPGAQGSSFVAYVPPPSVVNCNSSPKFTNFPPLVLCTGEQLVFDHSAQDADGDSLVYSLAAPFTGGTQLQPAPNPPSAPPYDEVVWDGAFSALNPITANPGLAINPLTGQLTVSPTQQGQFVVGIRVQEFRDGVLLSENRRDFQFNVTLCEQNVVADIEPIDAANFCQGLTVNFFNESNGAESFYWDFGDPFSEDDTSTEFSPSYTYADTGTYEIMLVANPGFTCADTTFLSVGAYLPLQPFFSSPEFSCEEEQQLFSFEADGDYLAQSSGFVWEFGGGAQPPTSTDEDPTGIVFPQTGTFPVSLTVQQGGCVDVFQSTVTVNVPPSVEIVSQSVFCEGLTVNFQTESVNASNFEWNFGVSETDSDQATGPSPTYTYPFGGIFNVQVTAWNGNSCPVTDTKSFEVYPLLNPEIDVETDQCLSQNSFDLQLQGDFTNLAQTTWFLPGTLAPVSNEFAIDNLSLPGLGTYTASVVVSENGCADTATVDLTVHPDPEAAFVADRVQGCAPLQVRFENTSVTSAQNAGYLYTFSDTAFSAQENPVYTFTQPGIYDVSLLLTNYDGCLGSDSLRLNEYIVVDPSPSPQFTIAPQPLSVQNPFAEVISMSTLSGNTYQWEVNGMRIPNADSVITWQFDPAIEQVVSLEITNNFGCSGRAEQEVLFDEHIAFIPNAFTPDADGVNDLWRPTVLGSKWMTLTIYDHWGGLVYRESGEDVTWNGSHRSGDYFCRDGVYQYKLRITDYANINHDYAGNITLLR